MDKPTKSGSLTGFFLLGTRNLVISNLDSLLDAEALAAAQSGYTVHRVSEPTDYDKIPEIVLLDDGDSSLYLVRTKIDLFRSRLSNDEAMNYFSDFDTVLELSRSMVRSVAMYPVGIVKRYGKFTMNLEPVPYSK